MEKFIEFMQKHKWKGFIALLLSALAILLLQSCNVAKLASQSNEITDKHIERTTTIELEK